MRVFLFVLWWCAMCPAGQSNELSFYLDALLLTEESPANQSIPHSWFLLNSLWMVNIHNTDDLIRAGHEIATMNTNVS